MRGNGRSSGGRSETGAALDHSVAPPVRAKSRDWRKLTIVLGAIAALEALLLLVLAVVLIVPLSLVSPTAGRFDDPEGRGSGRTLPPRGPS